MSAILTGAQIELLRSLARRNATTSKRYLPSLALIRLGLAQWTKVFPDHSRLDREIEITDAGRAILASGDA